jgi:beta-galactosidase GanA
MDTLLPMNYRLFLLLHILLLPSSLVFSQNKNIPSLQKNGETIQLIVEGKPFLVLGGELGNSSASNPDYMRPIWKKLNQMHCNTLLAPVYWELIEPEQGKFDFTLVDSLIDQARNHKLKLVLLWFGSWKNSMSCYVPEWVKKDYQKYPRAYDKNDKPQEILTPFHKNNLEVDISAFKAFLAYLKKKDELQQTVIMIQVENEIGMLPDARDYHPLATQAFKMQVPAALIQHLDKNKNILTPTISEAWKSQGYKTKGTWEEVFGKGLSTDEFFMAWHFADFANKVTAEGKKIYPLPMFVNAALNRPNTKPGDYPSGGPLPHLVEIWKAAAPAIDFLAPDFYNPDFKHWNDLFARKDNPLFIPEHKFEPGVEAKAFYAIGHYHAIGFSPFSIESTTDPENEPLAKSYDILDQLHDVITSNHGKNKMDGVLLEKATVSEINLGQYIFTFKHEYTMGWSPNSKEERWPLAGGLIIQLNEDEFIVAGSGLVVTFSAKDQAKGSVGILSIDEGKFVNGNWIAGRRMNGDQDHQGRHLRIPDGVFDIQRLKLYRYK